jgi:triosephosphate isomerase (TIM)
VSHHRKPLMAGNWKMNLNHFEAVAIVQKMAFALKPEDYDACEVAVLVPFTDLRSLQVLIDADKMRIEYGSQDISVHEKGAFTGEVSGAMLAKLGCSYAIVGHSERRQYHGETNEIINQKARAALANGITPIICFGEALEIRQAGDQVMYSLDQVENCLAGFTPEEAKSVVLAYEPIWAVGTGHTASPTDAQEVCGATRGWLTDHFGSEVAEAIRILYGGSMKASNVASLMAQPDIDGGLVGGASLDPDEFVAMARYRLLTP